MVTFRGTGKEFPIWASRFVMTLAFWVYHENIIRNSVEIKGRLSRRENTVLMIYPTRDQPVTQPKKTWIETINYSTILVHILSLKGFFDVFETFMVEVIHGRSHIVMNGKNSDKPIFERKNHCADQESWTCSYFM